MKKQDKVNPASEDLPLLPLHMHNFYKNVQFISFNLMIKFKTRLSLKCSAQKGFTNFCPKKNPNKILGPKKNFDLKKKFGLKKNFGLKKKITSRTTGARSISKYF